MESRVTASSEKIAAFDLDHTLLKPIGKNTFPQNKDDAQLVYPEITQKFNQLFLDGYKIVIFTNQKGIGKHTQIEDIYYKVDTFLPNGKNIDVYISYKSDKYRKPMPGMFDKFMENNGSITDIFYVGDAAGRKGDFSNSDAQFAHNCNIPFYTPEQYFLGSTETLPLIPTISQPEPMSLNRSIPTDSVIVLIGPPSCGKSTLAHKLAGKYPDTVVINNDTNGASKSVSIFKKALVAKTPRIIIDNTNATILNRAVYTELAKDNNYKVYAITFDIDRKVAMHLNNYRSYTKDVPLIPNVAYNSYYKRYEPANDSELYNGVMTFIPDLPSCIFEYSF
jgi:bifunctional polynucleotide phosphatase/kinase